MDLSIHTRRNVQSQALTLILEIDWLLEGKQCEDRLEMYSEKTEKRWKIKSNGKQRES